MNGNNRLYNEWSEKLDHVNTWLLTCREMVDGYKTIDIAYLTPSLHVASVIRQMAATMNGYFADDVPLELSQHIYTRTLEANISTEPLDKFLALKHVGLGDFTAEFISLMHIIITSLDKMVNYWYPLKIRR